MSEKRDKSIDVLKCFTKRLKELNVKIFFEENVKEIIINEGHVKGVKTDKKSRSLKPY